MAKFNLLAIFCAVSVAMVSALADSGNGPIRAAVDRIISTVNAIGFTGPGVQDLGFGFGIEYIAGAQEPIKIPESGINPLPEGELKDSQSNNNIDEDEDEEDGVDIPDSASVFNPLPQGEKGGN